MFTAGKVIVFLLSLLVIASNIVIFFYLKNIKSNCSNCVTKDHYLNNLIKGILVYNGVSMALIFTVNLINKNIIKKHVPKWVVLLLGMVQLVFTGILCIGLFVYYNKLEQEDCACLKEGKLQGMHKYLGVWRYFLLVGYSIAVGIPVIITVFTILSLMMSRK